MGGRGERVGVWASFVCDCAKVCVCHSRDRKNFLVSKDKI